MIKNYIVDSQPTLPNYNVDLSDCVVGCIYGMNMLIAYFSKCFFWTILIFTCLETSVLAKNWFKRTKPSHPRAGIMHGCFVSPGFGCRYSVVLVMMSITARAVTSILCKPQCENSHVGGETETEDTEIGQLRKQWRGQQRHHSCLPVSVWQDSPTPPLEPRVKRNNCTISQGHFYTSWRVFIIAWIIHIEGIKEQKKKELFYILVSACSLWLVKPLKLGEGSLEVSHLNPLLCSFNAQIWLIS